LQETTVTYTEEHWRQLKGLRAEAIEMMKPLAEASIYSVVYGSIARGDVKKTSDIDVFIPNPQSPTLIEAALTRRNIQVTYRELVQATPSYAAKAYIYIDEKRGYSFPMVPLRPSEAEFTAFAGQASLKQLTDEVRVPGVDKELMLKEPTETGHTETPIQGVERAVAKRLGVDIRIVNERVRTLTRRNRVGRTGVYVKRVLSPDESFSQVMDELYRSKPALRRRLRKKG